MLTDPQAKVLGAINDYCEMNQTLLLQHRSMPLPDLLADLGLTDAEVYTSVADLQDLGLIRGIEVAEADYPVRVDGLTARGRQQLR